MNASLSQIEQMIVAGQISQARIAFRAVEAQSFESVEDAVYAASLYRRLDLNLNAVKILEPYVLGRGRRLASFHLGARLEYSNCLRNMGLLNESRKYLFSNELKTHPRAQFILGMSYLHDYELSKAEQVLRALYLKREPSLSHYEYQIIGVNLLSAILYDVESAARQGMFAKFFSQVKKECVQNQYSLLLAHLKVIDLQFKVLAREVVKADLSELNEVTNLPEFSQKTFELYHLLAKLQLKQITVLSFKGALSKLRKKCVELRLFEVVREVDFQSAKTLNHVRLLQSIYDQTRYSIYRSKVMAASQNRIEDRSDRVLMNHGASNKIFEFDLGLLKAEPLLVEAFQLLAQEQYMPLSNHFLWNELMVKRQYIEPSSRNSILQLVQRLRKHLELNGIPLEILFDETGYRLKPKKGYSVKISWPSSWSQQKAEGTSLNYLSLIHVLKSEFKIEAFKLSEVLKVVPAIPKRTVQLFLAQAVSQAVLTKSGMNKGTVYRFV